MILSKLILAHLLGDFVFQSNDLIHKKYKTWIGILQHAGIVTVLTALVLFPYWSHRETWMAVGTIFLIHYLQDLLKIEYELYFNRKRKSVLPFFIDQALHLALLTYLAPRFDSLSPLKLPEFYSSNFLSIFFIGVLLCTYTYDITLYQFKHRAEYRPDYPGMRKRLLLFCLLYFLFFVLYRSLM